MQKISQKILANQIHQYIARIIYHGQVEFSPGMQAQFNTQNQARVTHQINNLRKKKKHDIISHLVEEAFEKIRHPFTIKIPSKAVGKEFTYKNPHLTMLNGEILNPPSPQDWEEGRHF